MMQRAVEALRFRGVHEMVHISCDHTEPGWWAAQPDADISQIADLIQRCLPARMSFFYLDPFTVAFKKDTDNRRDILMRRDSRFDETCVVLYDNKYAELSGQLLKFLSDTGEDIHVHFHHEGLTKTNYPDERMTKRQCGIHDYVCNQDNLAADHERVEFKIELMQQWIADVTGKKLLPWLAVHGCWSFAGSSDEICQLNDEVSILVRHGCIGDMSFPAPRREVDPILKTPFTFKNVPIRRAYDSAEGDARPIEETGLPPDRFFCWNAGNRVRGYNSSIDSYSESSESNVKRMESDRFWLAEFLQKDLPVVNGIGLLKTHSHSLHRHYLQGLNNPKPPLERAYRTFLGPLADACENAGISWEWLTVCELMAKLKVFCPTL